MTNGSYKAFDNATQSLAPCGGNSVCVKLSFLP